MMLGGGEGYFLVNEVNFLQQNVNIMSEQRTSAQHIAAIKDGIQNLDKSKVRDGLKGLYRAILDEEEGMPLSPFFDLVTTMRHGREDFLSLDVKYVFSVVTRHMARRVYEWDQSATGVAQHTKEALQENLDRLLALLEPTKEPCVTSMTNIEITKILVSQLSLSSDSAKTDLSHLLSTTVDGINQIKQFWNESKDVLNKIKAKDIHPIALPLKILGLIYEKTSTKIFEFVQDFKEQQIALQLAMIDGWRDIFFKPTGNVLSKEEKEGTKKVLEGLLQHFTKGFLSEKDIVQKTYKGLYEEGCEILRRIKGTNTYREALIGYIVNEIKEIEESLHEEGKEKEVIQSLRNVAFYALVDLYARTTETFVKCEILNVFGEMATRLQSDLLNDNSLNQLIATRGSTSIETALNKGLSGHIEAVALMNLIWVVWPANINKADPVILSLHSGDAQALSKKWQLQCTAVEALLRFDHLYREETRKKPEEHTPIVEFLEEVGREYQLLPLFVNRLGLSKTQVDELREFIAHTHGTEEESLQNDIKSSASMQSLTKDKNKVVFHKTAAALNPFKHRKKRESPQEKWPQEKLKEKREAIKRWLESQMGLKDEECEILLSFLQEAKTRDNGENEHPPYSDHPVRPVLNDLIDKFYFTQSERELIDKVIFQGQGKNVDQTSRREWLAEAIKSFFAVDHHPKIACAFNNLDKIKAMIEEEEKTKGRFTD
jgi:hypothetical protein